MIDYQKCLKDFPILNKTMQNHRLVYLDNAATTFKPTAVLDSIKDYYENYCANTHRGDYDIAHTADVKYDEARQIVADFIGADKSEVVFTAGASMSLNMIAYGYAKFLQSGDEILITEAEHAANVLPWFTIAKEKGCIVRYIPLTKEGRLTIENVKKAMTDKVKVIAVAQVTNVLGFTVDIKSIAKIAHKHGAILVCDGAQSIPHFKVDVKDLDCDFLAFSGHKMCGPTGIGVMYGKFNLLKEMEPLMSGGGMNARFNMCGEVSLLLPPAKFEAGTQNIEGAIGLASAIKYLESIGMDNIENHEKELRKYAVSKLKQLDNVILYNENAESGIITFNIKDVFAQDAATYFNSKGICVRSGQHCAKILIDFLGTVATVRASIYFYNTFEDIDALVEACKKAGDFLDAYFN